MIPSHCIDRQRLNRRRPENRRRQLQFSPPPWGSPDFLPVRDRLQRDGFDVFDPTSPEPLPRRRGPANRRAPSTPVEDHLPPSPRQILFQGRRDQLESPPPRPQKRIRRAPAPVKDRRLPREAVPELVLDNSDDTDDSDDESMRGPRRRRRESSVETDSDNDEDEDEDAAEAEEEVAVVDDEEQDASTDLLNEALAQVLLLFPDVLPSHVENLLAVHVDELGGNYAAAIEMVVALLVDDPAYPRLGEEGEPNKKEKEGGETDWLNVPARLQAGEKPDRNYKSHVCVNVLFAPGGLESTN